jgi:hypothetical protein
MIRPLEKDGKLDVEAISRLDAEARERGQRILFTIEDAAKDFYEFYDKFLTMPLARDLETGADRKKLLRYFGYEEFRKTPDNRVQSQEVVEKGIQEIARDLLQSLRVISPEKILEDIKSTLSRHHAKGIAAAGPEGGYYYKSQYVEMSAHKSEAAIEFVETFLEPSRGRRLIKEGYQGVYYPTYYVENE